MLDPSFMDAVYRGYVALLVLACAAAIFRSREDLRRVWQGFLDLSPMRRTASAMLASWAACVLFVDTTGIYDPWHWFILVDTLAAWAVLHQPAGKPQAFIGGIYMAQIMAHGIYGSMKLTGDAPNRDSYWQVLISLAIVALAILGGWYGGHIRRSLRNSRGGRNPPLPRAAPS